MSTDPLERHANKPVAWLTIPDDGMWAVGWNCQADHAIKDRLYMGTIVKPDVEGVVCAKCGEAAPVETELQVPGPNGMVQIYARINGTVASNPYLNPIATPYGANEESEDYDEAFLDAGLTDLGNAKRLLNLHHEKFRYVPDWKSFQIYDGFHWRPDNVATMERYAANTVATMTQALTQIDMDSKEREAFQKHVVASCSSNRLKAMVDLARSDPRVVLTPDHFDRAEHLLNVRNGTIDLNTGTRQDTSALDYITRMGQVDFEPDAECPLWDEFILKLCDGDDELAYWLQKAVGYTLTGNSGEQCFFFMYGDGANGKSTFLEVLRQILGTYATTLSFEMFLLNTKANVEHSLAALRGVRFATASEAPEGRRWNEELLKMITGGEVVRASMKYQNAFEFKPVAKIWFAANNRPQVNGVNEGIWRRFVPIPCRSHIAPEDRDGNLEHKLIMEAEGILAWAVRGAELWNQEGLRPFPSCVQQALDDYRTESDVFSRFMAEACLLDGGSETSSGALLRAYNEWAKESNEPRLNANSLGSRVAKFRAGKIVKIKSCGRMVYQGIKLLDFHDDQGLGRF